MCLPTDGQLSAAPERVAQVQAVACSWSTLCSNPLKIRCRFSDRWFVLVTTGSIN